MYKGIFSKNSIKNVLINKVGLNILNKKSINLYNYNQKVVYNFSKQNRNDNKKQEWHSTTILALKKNNQTFIIGDGQVTLGSTRVKVNGKKIRKINENTYVGFAGSLADAFTLLDGLELNIKKYQDQVLRACIEYAKEWRTGKQLRHLEASLLIISKDIIIEMDGSGNVVEIDDGVRGIGSGGLFAECAARALLDIDNLTAEQIGIKAMNIAADKCVYTSKLFTYQTVDSSQPIIQS